MSAPVSVAATQVFEFISGPGLSVLLLSVHPLHAFSDALGQQLSADHRTIALGQVDLKDLVVKNGAALRYMQEEFSRCGAPSAWGILPGYCLFRERAMLAWDSGLPKLADLELVARGAVVGAIWSGFARDPKILGEALHVAAEHVAAHRVAARFREAAANPARPRPDPEPPRSRPADDLTWAYARLGVVPGASDAEVHHAWRRQRMECHPDYAAGDAAEFERRSRLSADINRARDIIVEWRRR